MDLSRYFERDDGSLPQVDVEFERRESLQQAFNRLFELGAVNVTVNGGYLWIRKEMREVPFNGPQDAKLVTGELADSFHVVLGSIKWNDLLIPPLGILVDAQSLVIDYRMGSKWNRATIGGFIILLRSLAELGGKVSVAKWWGADGQEDFDRYLGRGA